MDIIKVKNVNKNFTIWHEKKRSIYDYVMNRKKKAETISALKNITFNLKEGECMGVIGRNGSGKSTLLRVIAGIIKADSGSIIVKGKVASFIEIGTGFQSDFTGRENVYLYSSLLGISKTEIAERFNEIVQITELEKFIDIPISKYSSGMKIRLAFATATMCNPHILLIDEIFSVGDLSFQKKSRIKIQEFKQQGKSIILVSHSPEEILLICDRCILLDHGKIIRRGTAEDVVNYYAHVVFNDDKKRFIENIKRIYAQIMDLELKKSKTNDPEYILQIEETILRLEQEYSYSVREFKSLLYTSLKDNERKIDETEIQKKLLENSNLQAQKKDIINKLGDKILLLKTLSIKLENEKQEIIGEIEDIIYMQIGSNRFDKFSLFRELKTLVDLTLEKDKRFALHIIKRIKQIISKEMKMKISGEIRQKFFEEIKWILYEEIKTAKNTHEKIRLIHEYKKMVLD